jgi:PEGA domain
MPHCLGHGLLVAPAVLVLLLGAPAAAQGTRGAKPLVDSLPPDIKSEYEEGKVLFHDGDFATALLKFQHAYAKTSHPRLLWNIAVCLKSLRHYAKTIEVLKRYLAAGGPSITRQDRQEAEDLLKAIEPFTTSVTFAVSEDGADLWLDDEEIGKSPLAAPIAVDIGMRRVRAAKDGFRPFEREIPVGGVSEATIEIKLERRGGHCELHVAPEATVVVDGKEVGHGPVVSLDLSVGGHALRVSAPNMQPYQGDITIEDHQTRSLEIKLEADPEQSSELHVAVRCRESDIVTPEGGLTVFLDSEPLSAAPLGVRKRLEDGRAVPAYVPFKVATGLHSVRVLAPGCDPLGTTAAASAKDAGAVDGTLPPDNPWFNGSPAGSPDGWRVGAGFRASTNGFQAFQNFFTDKAARAHAPSIVDVHLAGPSATAGLQGRWLTLLLDASYEWGSVTTPPVLVGSSSLSKWDFALRFGPRFPLYFVAVSLGLGANLGGFTFSPTAGAGGGFSGVEGGGGFWAAVDAQPLCDWGLQVGGETFGAAYSTPAANVQGNGSVALFVHMAYEPNRVCARKRSGFYRLTGTH